MVFGQSSEGGTHLPALRRAVTRQVVSVIITQRQEALQAGIAVLLCFGQPEYALMSLCFQTHGSMFHLVSVFTCCNELVNDDLSIVGKVSKLGFPNHQGGAGTPQAVAILKTQHGSLTQRAVPDLHRLLLPLHHAVQLDKPTRSPGGFHAT